MKMRFSTGVVLAVFSAAMPAHTAQPAEIAGFVARCSSRIDRTLHSDEYRVRFLGDNAASAARLLALVQSGEKSITFSTPRLYQGNRNLTPVRGSYTVLTDFDGKPGALLRTSWVRTKPFIQVSERESRYEGKPVRPLAAWRKVHWDFFTRSLAPFGERPSETMPVTMEKFDLVCVAGADS